MARNLSKSNGKGAVGRYDIGESTKSKPVIIPRADIYETEENIVVLADMPGVGPENLDVSIEGRALTIRGHVPEHAHAGSRLMHAEYGDADYQRVFTISEEIDRDRISARQRNGLLILELPKAAAAKARKIEVRTAA
ncbi:MAG: Hsp20/alpha crystallin family protein [Alphaproteobacteria bacterium]